MNQLFAMKSLVEVKSKADIFPEYKNTPIGLLLEYHNLNRTFCRYDSPQMLIGMCMDNRKSVWIPENFAFIIRSGGANLFYHEFQVSYAIGVGNVKHIALIGHNNCGMAQIHNRKDLFIEGMQKNAGWKRETAQMHFENLSPFFEIGDETEFLVSEARRIKRRYPSIVVAPLYFNEETSKIIQIEMKK